MTRFRNRHGHGEFEPLIAASVNHTPGDYLSSSYYERWPYALELLLAKHNLLSKAEYRNESRPAQTVQPLTHPDFDALKMTIQTSNQCITATAAAALLNEGLSCQVELDLAPQFQVGDSVRAKVMHPKTYTRLPRYVRSKVGTIMKDHGVYAFPDTMGQRLSQKKQHVYSARFAAQDLWGPAASSRDALYIDLFDDHEVV